MHCNYSLISHLSLQPWPSVSNLAKDFVERILTVDPSERLTAGQALKHPWVVSMAASSSMKNLQRCISQNLLKRASSRCHSTKSAQSTRSSRSTKSNKARRVREKELRELNRRYQQQYNGWNGNSQQPQLTLYFGENSTTMTELLQWLPPFEVAASVRKKEKWGPWLLATKSRIKFEKVTAAIWDYRRSQKPWGQCNLWIPVCLLMSTETDTPVKCCTATVTSSLHPFLHLFFGRMGPSTPFLLFFQFLCLYIFIYYCWHDY